MEKELRGKPKSKAWALALEINCESSDKSVCRFWAQICGCWVRTGHQKVSGWAAQTSPTVPTQTGYLLLLDQNSFSCPHSAPRESWGMPPRWWATVCCKAWGTHQPDLDTSPVHYQAGQSALSTDQWFLQQLLWKYFSLWQGWSSGSGKVKRVKMFPRWLWELKL